MTSLTIAIPTFNGATYLAETIISILQQSYSDFELLIVDDCSTDETISMVQAFQDPRLTFYRNPNRLGLVGNWNRCLELAQGEYVCIFHQDDVMMPDNIAKKVQLLADNPTVGMAYSNVYQIGPQGNIRSKQWYLTPKPEESRIYQGSQFFQRLITDVNIVCCPSVVIRRSVYEQLGGFDPLLPYTADWEMWLRIALFYHIGYLAEPLIKYRRHDKMETLNFLGAKRIEHAYRAKQRILEKYPTRIQNPQALQRKLTAGYTKQLLAKAQEAHQQQNYPLMTAYLTTTAHINQVSQAQLDWCLQILQTFKTPQTGKQFPNLDGTNIKMKPGFFEILDSLCGQDLGTYLSWQTIVKGLGFKIAILPGMRWLYRYRNQVKRFLDSA